MKSNDSNKKMVGSVFLTVNEDIMQNIFSRLPATSFASASCVSKSWNKACNRVLSKPKLASALSINPSLHVTNLVQFHSKIIWLWLKLVVL